MITEQIDQFKWELHRRTAHPIELDSIWEYLSSDEVKELEEFIKSDITMVKWILSNGNWLVGKRKQ